MDDEKLKYLPEYFGSEALLKTPTITSSTDNNANKYRSSLDRDGNFKLSVIIPTHNEESNLEFTLMSISNTLKNNEIVHEILVINDYSKDNTEELLRSINLDNLRYINNYYPTGYGYAVRCGLDNFNGDAVAIVMADSSDNPQDLVKYYLELLKGYDCVFGSRFLYESEIHDYPIHKLILNRIANTFIQFLFGIGYNDTTNAFKAYKREVIDGIKPLISHHFNLTVEMPLKAIVRGYSYSILPISWQNRTSGVSKLRIREMGSRYLFIVLSILLEKLLSRGDYIKLN